MTANTTVINSANADVNVSPRVVVSQPTYAQVTPVGHGVGTIGNAAHGATSNVVVHVNENITVVGSDNATINVEPSIVVSQPTHSMATVARHA